MENSYGIEIEQLKKIVYKKSLNRDRSQKEFEFFNEFCLCSLDLLLTEEGGRKSLRTLTLSLQPILGLARKLAL